MKERLISSRKMHFQIFVLLKHRKNWISSRSDLRMVNKRQPGIIDIVIIDKKSHPRGSCCLVCSTTFPFTGSRHWLEWHQRDCPRRDGVHPDVVLMDIRMPSWTLKQQNGSRSAHTIVLITGSRIPEMNMRAFSKHSHSTLTVMNKPGLNKIHVAAKSFKPHG